MVSRIAFSIYDRLFFLRFHLICCLILHYSHPGRRLIIHFLVSVSSGDFQLNIRFQFSITGNRKLYLLICGICNRYLFDLCCNVTITTFILNRHRPFHIRCQIPEVVCQHHGIICICDDHFLSRLFLR